MDYEVAIYDEDEAQARREYDELWDDPESFEARQRADGNFGIIGPSHNPENDLEFSEGFWD